MMREVAKGLLVRKGRVLMLRRAEHRKGYPGCWSFPGGHLEPGETPEAALTRELLEEIGVTPVSPRRLTSVTAPGPDGAITFHHFAVPLWEGEPKLIGTEHDDMAWLSLAEARQKTPLALADYPKIIAAALAPAEAAS